MVGLKSTEIAAFTEEEKTMLIQFIQKEYGGHTAKEFLDAFTLAVTGKLDVNVETYQNFSIAYVSKIMNAYRKWASKVYDENREHFERVEPKTALPPSEVDWMEVWEDIKAGKTAIIPEVIYEWGVKKGLIPQLGKTEKYDYLRQASVKLSQEISLLSIPQSQVMALQKKYKDLNNPAVIAEAKRLIIKNYCK